MSSYLRRLQTKTKAHFTQTPQGELPVQALSGNQYYYVVYDYDNNYIDARAVEDLKDETIVKTFDKVFLDMEKKGHRPTLNITDNQAVTPLKKRGQAQGQRAGVAMAQGITGPSQRRRRGGRAGSCSLK